MSQDRIAGLCGRLTTQRAVNFQILDMNSTTKHVDVHER